ncbi:unnamed protein product [Dracunculus medinensis]|uniref:Aminotran_1_2 domain-containing protein n=1 Tax=Dracunculus medinensis TaxID=318479 RepID=A0A0N4U244_DRAME|nr:unnamed protein product [Dracunculus medinensis]
MCSTVAPPGVNPPLKEKQKYLHIFDVIGGYPSHVRTVYGEALTYKREKVVAIVETFRHSLCAFPALSIVFINIEKNWNL